MHWEILADKTKDLLAKRIVVGDLTEQDVQYRVQQKGVDMRIGLDIASMAFKRQVDQIIPSPETAISSRLPSSPAGKASTFLLDPMWAIIRPDLYEHIDGLRSVIQRKGKPPVAATPVAAPDASPAAHPMQHPGPTTQMNSVVRRMRLQPRRIGR